MDVYRRITKDLKKFEKKQVFQQTMLKHAAVRTEPRAMCRYDVQICDFCVCVVLAGRDVWLDMFVR